MRFHFKTLNAKNAGALSARTFIKSALKRQLMKEGKLLATLLISHNAEFNV